MINRRRILHICSGIEFRFAFVSNPGYNPELLDPFSLFAVEVNYSQARSSLYPERRRRRQRAPLRQQICSRCNEFALLCAHVRCLTDLPDCLLVGFRARYAGGCARWRRQCGPRGIASDAAIASAAGNARPVQMRAYDYVNIPSSLFNNAVL